MDRSPRCYVILRDDICSVCEMPPVCLGLAPIRRGVIGVILMCCTCAQVLLSEKVQCRSADVVLGTAVASLSDCNDMCLRTEGSVFPPFRPNVPLLCISSLVSHHQPPPPPKCHAPRRQCVHVHETPRCVYFLYGEGADRKAGKQCIQEKTAYVDDAGWGALRSIFT